MLHGDTESDDKIDVAVRLIQDYGWIDGAEHKAWVLDQVLQTLLGDEAYATFVEASQHDDQSCDDGEACKDEWCAYRYDEWDTGIAP